MANGFCRHGGLQDRCGELGTMGGSKSWHQGGSDKWNMIMVAMFSLTYAVIGNGNYNGIRFEV